MEDDGHIFGIYRAIVTDTSCFATTGKIKTRISAFNYGSVTSNLINGYNSNAFTESLSRDILTDIMLPFGGGYDCGMFQLPQVNSVGLVAFIDASRTMPIWLGYTANQIRSKGKITQLDFPSDTNNDNPAIYYDNETESSVYNIKDESSFILNTKSNTLPDKRYPSTMDWQNNPVENSVVLNKSKAAVYHRINDARFIDFSLANEDEEGSISLAYTLGEEESESLTMGESINNQKNRAIVVKNKNRDLTAQIVLSDDGGILIDAFEDNAGNAQTGSRVEASIKLTPASISLETGSSIINLSRNINADNEGISIQAKNIQINAENVSFGHSGYSFVVSPNDSLNFTLEDGSMLTTANNIRT